jgi:hypothetical protein
MRRSTLAKDEKEVASRDRVVVECELFAGHMPQVVQDEFSTPRCHPKELAVDLDEMKECYRCREVENVLKDF